MLSLLYSIGIRCYYLAIYLSSFKNQKAKKFIEGRKQIPTDIEKIALLSKQTIWFHCASVGEFEQGYPLLTLLRNQYPKYTYLITFFSPSGYEYVQKKYPSEYISYLPYDTDSEIDYFIRKINPKLVLFVKYEFWPTLIQVLSRRKIPIFLMSGIFKSDQVFFRWYGHYFRSVLKKIDYFFLQDEKSEELLHAIGIQNTKVCGDTRFDRVMELSQEDFSNEKIEAFCANQPIFIAGSVWDSDIPVLKEIISALPSNWKIILAPHEVNHFETSWIKEKADFYTSNESLNSKTLIINTMGILSKLYRFSSFTYVGGGLGKGLHNILEPAVYAKPILIGPNFEKFNEAIALVDLGCVFPVEDLKNIPFLIKKITTDNAFLAETKNRFNDYISVNTNVSEKIAVYLKKKVQF
jgi:3-deoxy-D-manno-octulosonic-acid transferase